ncbi:MAG: response regulator [Pseudanabaenaceae cyanobacterium bins.39]|nr:response regulator [Pseudanabaenaceae cyanobacterium bins.39]
MGYLAFSGVEPSRATSSKPKLLVVDDEQDNLDLLYRTFRRDFTVFRADSGARALEVLAKEGEMAVIISDQRMPEMKGTEFLSRTVSDFPDTMRVVLTGYTDITDLIEAINSGQVHKYITKPWEPENLKNVIVEASHIYDLLKRRSEELVRSQAQNALLSVVVKIAQNSQQLNDGLLPLAQAFQQNFDADAVVLRLVENGGLADMEAVCSDEFWDVSADPLVCEVIAVGKSQVALDCKDQDYGTNLAITIKFREEVLGVLAMRWRRSMAVSLGDVAAIQQCADEVAIALTCIRFYAKK